MCASIGHEIPSQINYPGQSIIVFQHERSDVAHRMILFIRTIHNVPTDHLMDGLPEVYDCVRGGDPREAKGGRIYGSPRSCVQIF